MLYVDIINKKRITASNTLVLTVYERVCRTYNIIHIIVHMCVVFIMTKKIIDLLFRRPSDVRYRDACAIVLRPANFTYDSATHVDTDGSHTVSEPIKVFFEISL